MNTLSHLPFLRAMPHCAQKLRMLRSASDLRIRVARDNARLRYREFLNRQPS